MKLVELLQNQNIIVQLLWGEQKIEFYSEVIEKNETAVFITPYVHNGQVLELNVTLDKGVICNVFTDEPVTKQRISWKGIELTTVKKNNDIIYCLKAHSYNAVSNNDDRRLHERTAVQIDACILDDNIGVTIHDISDTGLSFYAPKSFEPTPQQLNIYFTDEIGEIEHKVKVTCTISRVAEEENRNVIGCKLLGENKDYQIYELLKRLHEKAGH